MELIQIDSKQNNDSAEKLSKPKIDLTTNHVSDIKIWLVDPTYTQQQISSESMPAAIGGIATFSEKNLKLKYPIRLFKYPEKLSKALDNEIPDIIGFSNYMWNCELSLALARRIKEYSPDTIVVMGGPNYPVVTSEQESFLRKHPEIDFHIKGEGELAFANLVAELIRADMKKNNLKNEIPSVHYIMSDGNARITSSIERIKDLTEIPSPYLEGKLDEFFDGKLQPVIQTTRGCPFACTFCVEGMSYYTKIYRNSQEKTNSELHYIGSKMQKVKDNGGRNDLWIVDSNFGMYNQDLDTCQCIAECQAKYHWPEYLQCDTGKNNKPRVLDAARLVKGAMRVSASVQSLDPDVLKNIKRDNISGEEQMQLAVDAAEIDADSRSEIILALPAETLKSHFQTVNSVIDAGFNHVNTYQLMMLPGTELDSPETRKKYEIKTRFRILPRCFGYFEVLQKQVIAAEIEEVGISTNTLPFEDYVKCRVMHLLIHIFLNDGLFSSAIKFIKVLKLSPYRWLELIFQEYSIGGLNEVFEKYEQDTRQELWLNRDELAHNIQNPGVIIHLAGQTSHSQSFEEPLNDIDSNTKSTLFILEEIRKKKLKCRFILGSTFVVIGRPDKLPVDERTTCWPTMIYGVNRLASEHYCKIYHEVYGIDTVIFRITNSFGPREQVVSNKNAVNFLIHQAFLGKTVTIFKKGKFFRDLIYISDVVSGIKIIMKKGKAGELYWISSGRKTWFHNLGKSLEKLTDAKVKFVKEPNYTKKVDVGNFVVNNSKLRALGWKPKISLDQGIKETLEYFKSQKIT